MSLNISTKILCAVLAVSFLVMSCWGLVDFLRNRTDLSLDLRKNTELAADRLGQALLNPVWNLDDDEIGRIIDYETKSDEIRAVILRREGDDRLLAGRIKAGGSVAITDGLSR